MHLNPLTYIPDRYKPTLPDFGEPLGKDFRHTRAVTMIAGKVEHDAPLGSYLNVNTKLGMVIDLRGSMCSIEQIVRVNPVDGSDEYLVIGLTVPNDSSPKKAC